MHPAECPSWDYESFPNRQDVIRQAYASLFTRINSSPQINESTAINTRTAHQEMFARLTPSDHRYFAGHYRGEKFPCLEYYAVGVQGDSTVGHVPETVLISMDALVADLKTMFGALDAGHRLPNSQLSQPHKLAYTIAAACRMFTHFLQIHPYANGNGHAARLLLVCILVRYGYHPTTWTVEPRPNHPNFIDAIILHRQGNVEPLETLVRDSFMPRA